MRTRIAYHASRVGGGAQEVAFDLEEARTWRWGHPLEQRALRQIAERDVEHERTRFTPARVDEEVNEIIIKFNKIRGFLQKDCDGAVT
jgi:hypothetical protein